MNPLAITPGDPGGIGPDLCIQAAINGDLVAKVENDDGTKQEAGSSKT